MDREQPHGAPSPASTLAVDGRPSRPPTSPPQMSPFIKVEEEIAMAAEEATHTSTLTAAADYPHRYASEDDHFKPSLEHTESPPNAYMSPQAGYAWNRSVPVTAGSEDYEHYALHSSPAATGYPTQSCSNQSSPRNWGSPGQFRPGPWEPTTEPLQSQFPRHSPQQPFPGFPMRDGLGYVHSSQPVLSSTSFPASSAYLPGQGYESPTHGYPLREHVDDVYHQSPYPLKGLSSLPGSPGPISERGGDDAIHDGLYMTGAKSHSRQSSSVPSTPGNSSGAKAEEPYAQLIFRAFKSKPRHAMTLQDLYQWFRENTDKGKNDTKGWQNSIRHNLSMNRAFTKRERKAISGEDEGEEAAATADAGSLDNKKATEWFLEPWALKDGVQSTTRYRKGNSGRRSGSHRSAGASSTSKKHGSHSHITGIGSGSGRVRSRQHAQSVSTGLHGMHYPHAHHVTSLRHPHLSHGGRPGLSMAPFGGTASYLDYQQAHHDHPHQAQSAMFPSDHYHGLYSVRAHSESGVDEPLTPEASFPDGLMLPDPRGSTVSSSTNSAQAVAAAYYGAAGEGGISGVDMASYTYPSAAAAPPVVNVYDEVVDRYGGWGAGAEETTSPTGYHGHIGQARY